MTSLQQEIQIRYRYPVHFTTDLFAPENPLFAQVTGPEGRRVLFVVDEGVCRHHPGLLRSIEAYCGRHEIPLASPARRVPGGEQVKNEHGWVLLLHHAIERAGLCRHSFLAAIGGGAVLDMAGLAAATAHRGIRLIRIPTTVLSQNDSGVGVKNGINAFGKKNFLGTFAPPYAVLNDSRFLTTLPDREWRSGIAEAIKVSLIKDAPFFEFLEDHAAALASRDRAAMQRLIYRCAELHLQHIASSGDPFEMGSARPLDFGHWSAHKLEQLSGYRLRHGEAVAIGIALDTTYSYLSGLIPEPDWRRVLRLLRATGLPTHAPELSDCLDQRDSPRCILRGLTEFREHLGGELTITLLERIGRGLEVHAIDERRMAESIALLERLAREFGDEAWQHAPHAPDQSDRSYRTDLSEAGPEGRGPSPFPCRTHVSSEGEALWKPAPKGQPVP
jgi:3-dehydroquinate synthase